MELQTERQNIEPSVKSKLTPLMVQYWDIKAAHDDKIVLFRMGDFYEMFHRDAEIAAPVIGIALTSRNKKSQDETPMCGVPHHSVANAINKLLGSGFKVAICDQIEDPKLAKGLVKRAITRILSPGMVYDPDTLDGLTPNYLASFDAESVSFLDATTGESFFFLTSDPVRRKRILQSLMPVEILVSPEIQDKVPVDSGFGHMTVTVDDLSVDLVSSIPIKTKADAVLSQAPPSAVRLLNYAVQMQGEKVIATTLPFERRELLDHVDLPAQVFQHLEIFSTYKNELKGSLFYAVNRCKTAIGSRLLRSRLQFPLLEPSAITLRLDEVERWRADAARLQNVRAVLARLGDVQRRLAKLASPSVNPRDLQALAESLRTGLEVSRLSFARPGDEPALSQALALAEKIERVIVLEPPLNFKNGGVIHAGVSKELDELMELSSNSNELLLQLEANERLKTGISSLKVRFNGVFGYYIEITNTHKDKVPTERYERKQTLANAERYMTPELAELERKVLSAMSKRIELELEIFQTLVIDALAIGRTLLKLANTWAELDVSSALAWLSLEQDFCRPEFSVDGSIDLVQSRHPVIEQSLSKPFTANDIRLQMGSGLLLTGPNMAGKSTLMRTVALVSLLAQVGSFVPARRAKVPLFARILTRIGASDSLAEGLSTFMVEMKETAEILKIAEQNSLIILDEIGRGTSTYDGMSLAQGILENLLERRGVITLFATHYHELTRLTESHGNLHCGHMKIHEKNGEVTFLHQLAPGPANKSYGIHVARLAGLPNSVTARAQSILKRLESGERASESPQLDLLNVVEPAVGLCDEEIRNLELNRLTPLEALNQIAKWQQRLS